MIRRLKSKFQSEDNKRLLSNFISLAILQGTNYILPLLTLPYLVRVLGIEYFGLLAFATAIIAYFSILTDYGFNLAATREVSIYRMDNDKLVEIFSSVMTIKVLLMFLSFLFLSVLVFSFEKFSQHFEIYFLTFGTVIGQVLFPTWFFQGMERMKYITYLNILAKFIFTVAIFIFVKKQSDFWIVPLLTSMGFIVAGIWSLVLIKKEFGIGFEFQKLNILKIYLYGGWHIFASGLFTMFYVNSAVVILGFFANNTVVGYYTLAEKVVKIISSLYAPIQDAIYPYIIKSVKNSKEKSLRILNLLLIYSSVFMLTLSVLIFIFANNIILLLSGYEIKDAVKILRILSLYPLIITIAKIYAMNYIITFKLEYYLIKVYSSTALLSIVLFSILIPNFFGVGAALSIILIEVFATAYMYIIVQKKIKNA